MVVVAALILLAAVLGTLHSFRRLSKTTALIGLLLVILAVEAYRESAARHVDVGYLVFAVVVILGVGVQLGFAVSGTSSIRDLIRWLVHRRIS